MVKYHKINSVFKRDNKGRFIYGEYSCEEFKMLKDIEWECTEKLDGMNIRVHFDYDREDKLKIAGRTDSAQLKSDLVDWIKEKFSLDYLNSNFNKCDVTFFGEGVGPKIQKGGENFGTFKHFVLFDVLIGGIWLSRESVNRIAQGLNIKYAPVVMEGTIDDVIDVIYNGIKSQIHDKRLFSYCDNFLEEPKDFYAEGLVLRPPCELKSRLGQRIITKLKTKDFK